MIYKIKIEARIESNLSNEELESQLVVALHNTENQYSKFDGVDENLEVNDYILTNAKELCPNCEIELIAKVFDIDGESLRECNICEKCGYGTPALH